MGLEALLTTQIIGLQPLLDAKLGGSTGSTDNRVLRSDGTGGVTVQDSAVTIDDSGNISGLGTVGCGAITISGTAQILGTNGGIRVPAGGNGFWFTGGGYFICPSNGVFKFSDSTDATFNRLQLGGATSSFPSVKRNGAQLQVRLADDSADAALACGAITASGVVLIPDGAVGSPALAFASDTDTGIYRSQNNAINFACGGQLRQQFQSDGSISLGGTDPWIYTGYYAIRQGGSGVINLRASNGTTPATVSLGTLNASALVNVGTYTFGTLPAAGSNAGALAQITDSSVTTNGTIAAGGGSDRAIVFSDGTDWIVAVA